MKRNKKNGQGRQSKRQTVKNHTLVLHINPDLESTVCAWMIMTFPVIATALGFRSEDIALKFIPAGTLRKEDWPGQAEVTQPALARQGYLFIDVIGGDFDHHPHGADKDGKEQSSLDIVIRKSGAEKLLGHMASVFTVISRNDLRGQQVVQDKGRNRSSTPHTAQHLRHILLGWNRINPTDPESVMHLAHQAYCGIESLVRASESGLASALAANGLTVKDMGGDSLPALARTGLGLDGFHDAGRNLVAGEFFLAANILVGVRLFLNEAVGEGALDTATADDCMDTFRESVATALHAMEAEWQAGVSDVNDESLTKVYQVNHRIPTSHSGIITKKRTLVVGTSDSWRYSAVTRYGIDRDGARHKADITVQFGDDGRFVISTSGMSLERVAAEIRMRDLVRKGVDPVELDMIKLRDVGHMFFKNQDGQIVEPPLLAYDSAFGNRFRANPYGVECALDPDDIVDAIRYVLETPE